MANKNYGDNSQLAELIGYISNNMKFPLMGAGGGFAPIGTESYFDGTSAPQGWLLCNGQTLNITDYPELAAYFASHHGSSNYYGGNGTTTFALPTRKGMPNNEDVNYNTSEHIIGVWTDGKPLYEKTISCGALPNNTTKFITHNINNARIKKIYGYAYDGTNVVPLPNVARDAASIIQLYATATNVGIMTSSNLTAYTETYITLQYTKSTDSAVSAGHSADGNGVFCIKATVAGDPNGHVYSTEEHVVGTWIDGKPIYEKTLALTTPSKNTGQYSSIGVSIKTVVDCKAMFKNTYNTTSGQNNWMAVNCIASSSGDTAYQCLWVQVYPNDATSGNKNSIYLKHNQDGWGGKPLYVTVQYTKTTD